MNHTRLLQIYLVPVAVSTIVGGYIGCRTKYLESNSRPIPEKVVVSIGGMIVGIGLGFSLGGLWPLSILPLSMCVYDEYKKKS